MVIMAGMLPGVECARRRRRLLRQGSAEAPAVGSSGSKQRSSVCTEMAAAATTTLDSNAREAKERLDQKLRSQRESVVKRHHSTGSLRLPGKPPAASAIDGERSTNALQREVFLKKKEGGGGRRRRWFSWGRRAAEQPQPPECAVCLEEFRAGDALVHLPCGHRFHWPCAVPWVQAASRCPLCRAAVDLADDELPSPGDRAGS